MRTTKASSRKCLAIDYFHSTNPLQFSLHPAPPPPPGARPPRRNHGPSQIRRIPIAIPGPGQAGRISGAAEARGSNQCAKGIHRGRRTGRPLRLRRLRDERRHPLQHPRLPLPDVQIVLGPRTQSDREVTQWLIYWVIFAFFSIIEVFVDVLLYWIPFYYAFKLAFLLWAMLPRTRGAKFLYDSFLKDFLKSNESKIDAALNNAKVSAEKVAAGASAAVAEAKKSTEDKKDE